MHQGHVQIQKLEPPASTHHSNPRPNPIPRNFDGNKPCTYHLGPPNVNNSPLPNHENQGINMITLNEEYDMRGTIVLVGNTKAVAATSSVAPFITDQLRAPLTIQTYQPRSVVTTTISKKLDYNSKVVPWDYKAEAKTNIINTATAHGMTKS
ncbi:hypothetical protein HAX54_001943 [Datura stramonium]|uniref:Uncharacterized protein n=1 Tax=Datura stramonium TaxID=4076 RepID=A0ABS8T330_DATST|nr:hypothetical protein [Datura stramonium]